jgi:hypothetical protein
VMERVGADVSGPFSGPDGFLLVGDTPEGDQIRVQAARGGRTRAAPTTDSAPVDGSPLVRTWTDDGWNLDVTVRGGGNRPAAMSPASQQDLVDLLTSLPSPTYVPPNQ